MYILYFSCFSLYYYLFFCSHYSSCGHWTRLRVSSSVPLPCSHLFVFLSTSLLSGIQDASRLIIRIFCTSPRIRHLSKEVSIGYACCYWSFFVFNIEEMLKGLVIFGVQILLDLGSVSFWYLAFTFIHMFNSYLLNIIEQSWMGRFRENRIYKLFIRRETYLENKAKEAYIGISS